MSIVLGKKIKQSAINGFCEEYYSYVPDKFPLEGGFVIPTDINKKAAQAHMFIGKLGGISMHVPDKNAFITLCANIDSSASSQIEGTTATFQDALLANVGVTEGIPDDVDDIIHHGIALRKGEELLKSIPLSGRFIKEIHKVLMNGARGNASIEPGEFRKVQNWIGGRTPVEATFVPPPPEEIERAIGDLEKFIHLDNDLIPIIRVGLTHAQFESIHPFTDGNGRVGRLLIAMMMIDTGLIDSPLLMISEYFKKHRSEYYKRINNYHEGDIEGWLNFFLDAVIDTSRWGCEVAEKIGKIRLSDSEKIAGLNARASQTILSVMPHVYGMVYITPPKITEKTGLSRQGSHDVINRLVDLGILKETPIYDGKSKVYVHEIYLSAFNSGI